MHVHVHVYVHAYAHACVRAAGAHTYLYYDIYTQLLRFHLNGLVVSWLCAQVHENVLSMS